MLAAVREQGVASLDEVEAVVLETDGTFAVVRRAEHVASPARSTLTGLQDGVDGSG